MPKRFFQCGFSTFETKNKRQSDLRDGLKNFALDETETRSLLFCGNVGSGKTHLAVSVLKNLPPKDHGIIPCKKRSSNALFLNADGFFMSLQNVNQMQTTKDAYIKDLFLKNDMICLDDLSSFNFTAAKTENLYYFINEAYMNEKRFIITTNYNEDSLKKIDPRIYSRIAEMSLIIKFIEDDFRLAK